jgi:hypothetical protein
MKMMFTSRSAELHYLRDENATLKAVLDRKTKQLEIANKALSYIAGCGCTYDQARALLTKKEIAAMEPQKKEIP